MGKLNECVQFRLNLIHRFVEIRISVENCGFFLISSLPASIEGYEGSRDFMINAFSPHERGKALSGYFLSYGELSINLPERRRINNNGDARHSNRANYL